MNKRLVVSLGLALVGAGLFFLLLKNTGMSWETFRDTLKGMNLLFALGCPAILSGLVLFSALKWKLVTEAHSDEKLGLGFYYRYIAFSVALGQVLPLTLTNATVRAVALKRKDVMPVMKTAGLFVWDQGFDFLTLLLLVISGLIHLFWELGSGATFLLFAACSAVIVLAMPLFTNFVIAVAALLGKARFVPSVLRSRFEALSGANILSSQLARKLFLMSVAKFLLGSSFYTCAVMAFGHANILDVAFWGAPTAEMAGILSQMPGGLGALDWTWVGIFTGHGFDGQSATALAFGIRCALFSGNMLLALVSWSLYLLFFKFRRACKPVGTGGE